MAALRSSMCSRLGVCQRYKWLEGASKPLMSPAGVPTNSHRAALELHSKQAVELCCCGLDLGLLLPAQGGYIHGKNYFSLF